MPRTPSKQYELARAYVAVLPSLHGLQQELHSQFQSAMPAVQREMASGMTVAIQQGTSGIGATLTRATAGALTGLSRSIFSGVGGALGSVGRTFQQTLVTAANAGGAALTTAVGAVGVQVIGGGFSRALGINEAEAKLHALGYQGAEFSSIMQNAVKAVDGTSYTLQDSVGAAGQLLAAGIKPGKELEGVLANIGKLTDMSGTRSYGDISSMFGKNAAAGIIQMEDLNQLIDSGVAILPALAKQFGKTTLEVRKMSSEGKITFEDFNRAVESMVFDSALYARENVKAAFKNLRSQLSKIGAELWKPLIEGAGPIFMKIRAALVALQKNTGYTDFVNRLQTKMADALKDVDLWAGKLENAFQDQGKVRKFFDDLIKSFEGFKAAIKNLEGPVYGLGLAFASTFLKSLPVVGGLFGAISPAVGLMGGALFEAYQNSELLQGAIKNVGEKFKGFKTAISGGDGLKDSPFKALGDSLGVGLNALMVELEKIDFRGILEDVIGGISTFINTLVAHRPEISAAFTQVVDAFKAAGTELGGGEGGSFFATLAEGVVKGIQIATQVISAVIPIITNIIKTVTAVITSDFAKGVFGWFMSFAKFLAEHKGLATVLLGTIVAFKLVLGPIIALVLGFSRIAGLVNLASGVASVAGGAATRLTLSLTSVFQALAAVGKIIMASLPEIAAGAAAIAALILAIGGVTWLLDKMGFFEILHKILNILVNVIQQIIQVVVTTVNDLVVTLGNIFQMIAGAVTAGWRAIEPIATWLRDSWLLIFNEISSMVLQAIPVISQAIEGFIRTMATAAVVVIQNLDALLVTLAENGVAAGAGALAAAGGLLALAGAMAAFGGGNLLADIAGGIGTLWTSLVGSITGEDASAIGQLTELATAISNFNGDVGAMPEAWTQVGSQAYGAGYNIMEQFGQGMLTSLTTVEMAMIAAITGMLTRLQATVYATPINLNVGNPALAGVSTGSSTYNSNTNYNVNVNNSSVLTSLARSSR